MEPSWYKYGSLWMGPFLVTVSIFVLAGFLAFCLKEWILGR